jgi:hypothetical protein
MGRKRTLAPAAVDEPDYQRQDDADDGADDGAMDGQAAHQPPDEPAEDGEDQEEAAGGMIASGHCGFMADRARQFHMANASLTPFVRAAERLAG